MLPLAGLLTGVVAIWVPQVMGNGRATAQLSFSSKADLAVVPILLVSFLAKAIVTLLTIRSGASGGVLQPGIALGASGGCCAGCSVDAGVSHEFDWHVRSAGCVRIARSFPTGSAYGDLLGDGTCGCSDQPVCAHWIRGCGECVHRIRV